MALDGFTVGGSAPSKPAASGSASQTSATGALAGFGIGNAAATPSAKATTPVAEAAPKASFNVDKIINLTKPADTSDTFAKSLGFTQSFATPKVQAKSDPSSTPATDLGPKTDLYTGDPIRSMAEMSGDKLSAPSGNTRGESLPSKIVSTVKDFLFNESSDRKAADLTIENLIQNNNLLAIGKQLGIDKQIPVDKTKDPSVQSYYHDKAVTDYVRNNYGQIRSSLVDPAAIPEQPEMLGPTYADVNKNFDQYAEKLGLKSTPSVKQVLSYALTAPVMAAFATEAAVPIIVGLAGFEAFSLAEHAILGDSLAGKASDYLGLNSNMRNVLDLVEMFGVGYGLHAAYTKAPEFATKWTKNITEEYMPGQVITFDPVKVRAALTNGATRGEITPEEVDLINKTVGKGGLDAWKAVLKNGTTIEVPADKVVTITDKPYWAKIKDTLGVESKGPDVTRTSVGDPKTMAGAPRVPQADRLLGEGAKTTQKGAEILHDEINKSIETHGVDLTSQLLQDRFRLDASEANDLIRESQARTALANPDKIAADVLGKVAPEAVNAPSKTGGSFRPVEPNEIIPAGYTTKMNVTTGEQLTNAPSKSRFVPNESTPEVKPAAEAKTPVEKVPKLEKPKGTVVKVNEQDFVLSGKAEKTYLEAKASSDERLKLYKGDDRAGAVSKAEGMKLSALKRELTGNYTPTEIRNRLAVENSNYDGKKVLVDVNGKKVKGTIRGTPSYGKFKVELADGTKVSKVGTEITDPRTKAEIHAKITARKDASLYEPKEAPTEASKPAVKSKEASKAELAKKTEPAPTEPIKPIKPTEGTGATKTRGLAEGVEAKAIEKKLTTGFGDLPEYQQISMKAQAEKAAELISTDYEKAKRIAMGLEIAPEGLLPESVFVGVENKAIADGDVETLRDLATSSNLTAEATTMGQRIRTLGERDPDSPVKAIADVAKARKEAFKNRVKNADGSTVKVKNTIKSEIKKATPTKETWSDFIKSIQC